MTMEKGLVVKRALDSIARMANECGSGFGVAQRYLALAAEFSSLREKLEGLVHLRVAGLVVGLETGAGQFGCTEYLGARQPGFDAVPKFPSFLQAVRASDVEPHVR